MAATIRAGVAAARVLQQRGVRYAFGVPGESFLGLLDALHETPEIQLISTRHEGGAAFMAEAVGKLTGVPAICMGTRGVGTANLAIGIHTAYQDSTPLIALVGQVETPFRHREALQEVELAPFLSHITKWAIEAPNGERLPDLVSEAFRLSIAGRPGPVAIALRGDILDEDAPADLPRASAEPVAAPDQTSVNAALALLNHAARPLIIAGGGVSRSGSTGSLVALAERIGVPVMTAFRRHDAFPNDHPLYVGSLSIGAPAPVVQRACDADVILAIGTRLAETTTFGYTLPAPGTRLIHVDVSPEVTGRTYPAEIAIAADAGKTIEMFLATVEEDDRSARSSQNVRDRATYEEATTLASPVIQDLVDPAFVIAQLQRQLPAGAVLTSDAGNFYGWLSRYFRFRQPGTFLGPTSGAMGYAVPAAVAAALVRENRVPAVAIAGDGGFLMTGNELAVAAQLDLDVTCIVFNNAMYGTIRLHQERTYPGRVSGTDLWSPDFVRYAEAFGGLGVRVERNEDVADGVRQVLGHRGVSILEVAVSPDAIAVGQSLQEISQRQASG
ncbi:MAG TPA: thiamine pyrophosphate-dependent enzyme [Thermomicrobiales bacterium]|nr:thiamine pyrophosphate-dependent enzyme [Thermomicrobiales bacterium]